MYGNRNREYTKYSNSVYLLFHQGSIQGDAFPVAAVAVPVILIILIAGTVAGFFVYRRKTRGNVKRCFKMIYLLKFFFLI